jgi:hypothetical protein
MHHSLNDEIHMNSYAWYFDNIVWRFQVCSKLHMVFPLMIFSYSKNVFVYKSKH